jgi:hypothetical protein
MERDTPKMEPSNLRSKWVGPSQELNSIGQPQAESMFSSQSNQGESPIVLARIFKSAGLIDGGNNLPIQTVIMAAFRGLHRGEGFQRGSGTVRAE